MANGHVRRVFLAIFRIIQFTLSIVAVACGAFIIYTMHDMAKSAKVLEDVISRLKDNDSTEVLRKSLVPVLRYLQGTSARAITITCVASWSTILIIYLVFANRSSRTTDRDLKRNSRACRILLSLFTVVLWTAAIVCSALLVLQYGIFAITVGPQTKIAFVVLKEVITEAIQQAAETSKTLSNALNIVSKIMTIGAMSIVLLVSSIICCAVALFDCFIACCVSGKAAQTSSPQYQHQTANTDLEKGGFFSVATPQSAHTSPYQSSPSLPNQMQTQAPCMAYSTPQQSFPPQQQQQGFSHRMSISPQQSFPPQQNFSQQQYRERSAHLG